MSWNKKHPLLIGRKATASSRIASVEKKGFDDVGKRPMLFVKQRIDITMTGMDQPSVLEERSHVYFCDRMNTNNKIRKGK